MSDMESLEKTAKRQREWCLADGVRIDAKTKAFIQAIVNAERVKSGQTNESELPKVQNPSDCQNS